MGKAPFQPERSGKFSAGDGTGVEPVEISLGKVKRGCSAGNGEKDGLCFLWQSGRG